MDIERPVKREDIGEQELDGELMLHDPVADKIHLLNMTSRLIWDLADGSHTLSDMEEELRERFSIGDAQDVKGDIKKVISELREKGMIG